MLRYRVGVYSCDHVYPLGLSVPLPQARSVGTVSGWGRVGVELLGSTDGTRLRRRSIGAIAGIYHALANLTVLTNPAAVDALRSMG